MNIQHLQGGIHADSAFIFSIITSSLLSISMPLSPAALIAATETAEKTPTKPADPIRDLEHFMNLPEWMRAKEMDSMVTNLTHAAIWLAAASIALIILCKILAPLLRRHMSPQASTLLLKIIRQGGFILIIVEAFSLLGFDIITLLGAASIIGVAVGFASQTSLSNIISGLFLVGERQINLGDIVEINGIRGTVDSINLMSVQLRLPDNTMVRIPNEMIIKNPVSNATRFETRRCDISFSVDYNSNLDKVITVLNKILASQPLSLDDPAPSILFAGFQDSGIGFTVGAWCERDNYGELRMDLAKQIKREFDKEGISMPFPIVSIDARNGAIPVTLSKNESPTQN